VKKEGNQMLNYIWAGMILAGILYGVFSGNTSVITSAVLKGAGEGISLCITMAGVVAFWMGLMEIAKMSGLIEGFTKKVEPFLRFCFPNIPKGHPAMEYICANVIANVLGLGWACTTVGLKAMEALGQLEAERGNPAYQEQKGERVASKEMCTFLILNISSLQLLPVNIIAYREQYGSGEPTRIIGPALVATLVSTLAAVIFCKIADKTGSNHFK
jgi:spore maturation protein A